MCSHVKDVDRVAWGREEGEVDLAGGVFLVGVHREDGIEVEDWSSMRESGGESWEINVVAA